MENHHLSALLSADAPFKGSARTTATAPSSSHFPTGNLSKGMSALQLSWNTPYRILASL